MNGTWKASACSQLDQKTSPNDVDHLLNNCRPNLACLNPGLSANSQRVWGLLRTGSSNTLWPAHIALFILKDGVNSVHKNQCLARESQGTTTSKWTGVFEIH